jgi:hypothetical protein
MAPNTKREQGHRGMIGLAERVHGYDPFTISANDCAAISGHHHAVGGPIRQSHHAAANRNHMRPTHTIPALKPSAAGRFAGEFRRAILACGFGLAVCVGAVVLASWTRVTVSAPSRSSPNEGDLSTGSLLFVTPTGNRCLQRTIDNNTWLIRNNGWVDCEEALAKAARSGADSRTPGSRLDLIREGFRGGR